MATIDFESLPFLEAIESLRQRVVLPRGLFDQLKIEGKARAFTMANIDSMKLLTQVYEAALASVTEGLSFRDFVARVPETLQVKGWTAPNPYHALLVFSQQAFMAYNAGQYSEMVDAGADSWMFETLDAACPLCSSLDGMRFGMDDRRWWPPVHFHCNCQPVIGFADEGIPLSDGRAIEQWLASAPDTDAGRYYRETLVTPKNPFRWDPAEYANINPPDFAQFPEALRPLFEAKFGEAA